MHIRTSWPKLVFGVVFSGLTFWAIYWRCWGALPQATAAPQAPTQRPAQAAPAPTPPSADQSRNVVAYIYGNVPITREMLGEYLIARMGASRLDNLINKLIIDQECQKRGIEVTTAEVEEGLLQDLKSLKVNRQEFVERVLKQYRKTLYEWKEDVIRPRLLMTKLVRDRVQVSDKDITDAYQAYYGEKVDCRIILWPKDMKTKMMTTVYPKIRDDAEEFDREARKQPSPTLAADGGKVAPIARNSTGNPELEKEAFSLKPGEVSRVLDVPEGIAVMKCMGRIAAENKDIAEVRDQLMKEITDKKIHKEIPKVFEELYAQAKPAKILKEYESWEEVLRDVHKDLPPGLGKVEPGTGTPGPK